ncbi:FUSC family protein [Maribrevibacterium harenarium]|uniref:FUSC family protein n=1 Tax=Maribrevibacterium harenarium TaxID=2589817 RepID=A0A501WYR8_9GAMM|nr:FUSC family protein [Maribrevibacterium harenarium]TPE53434.1 FUSC family protein [Maribrevibacterium harenarium]
MLQGVWSHLRPLLALNDTKRPVGFLITVALAMGMPGLIGAALGQFELGAGASIGGFACLYMRQTPIPQRLLTIAVATFGLCSAYMLGLLLNFSVWSMTLGLGLVSFWATYICRYFSVPAPGSFFFVLVVCIAAALPFDLSSVPERLGFLFLGCFGSMTLALAYSLLQKLRKTPLAQSPIELLEMRLIAVALEAGTIALFVAGSFLLAILLGFEKPYWVPISCAAILQGASFRAVWHRNVHRTVGTFIGFGLTSLLFALEPGPWLLAIAIVLLSFLIEFCVTRNYGLAVIFITPLTIILAEATHTSADVNSVIWQRVFDVILGSAIGFIGGWLLHRPGLYERLEQRIRRCLN